MSDRISAVIYAAKSTPDPRGSIPDQLDDCRAFTERMGWALVGEYSDEDESAWKKNRGPQLAAAMEHAERESPSILVVQHSDRLARGDARQARHLAQIYFWALEKGVELRSVQDDSTFSNPILAVAMGERNAEDSRRKSLAVRAGLKRRAASGKPTGGPRPYGYRYRDGGFEIDPAERPIVERIFAEFAAGRSLTAIARGLHEDRVPTMRAVQWRQSTVTGILRHPVYTGRIRRNDETFDGDHEAIIDDETFDSCARLLEARKGRNRGRPPTGQHLFRGGFLRCASCGEAMVPRTNGGYQYYYCNGRSKLGRDHCSTLHIRRADIDSAVYAYFERVGLDVEATRQQVAESRDRKLAEIQALRLDAEHEAQRAAERLDRVRRDYQDGKLDSDDWREQREQLTSEHEASGAEATRLRDQEREIEAWGDVRDAEADTLRKLADIRSTIAGEVKDAEGLDAVRAALTRLFERFEIRADGDEATITPVARWSESWTVDEQLRPILRPTPLDVTHADNQRHGSPCREYRQDVMFGPIAVEIGGTR